MSLAESLPVYKASYDLILQLFQVIKLYPKEYKYSLWEQIKKDSLMIVSTVYKINISHDKISLIKEARSYLQSIKVLLRLSKDLHIISLQRFADLQLSIESISKQLVAWEKSCKS